MFKGLLCANGVDAADESSHDKKVVAGTLRFILARDIGEAFVTADVPRDVLMAMLTEALAD